MKGQFSENQLRNNFEQVKPPYVFLETLNFDKYNKHSFLFTDFMDILTFNYADNLNLFFKRIEDYLKKGYWLSGYFSYEFGYFLESALYNLQQKIDSPLAWLGVSKKPKEIIAGNNYLDKEKTANYKIENIRPNITREEYIDQIKKIKNYLEQGLTYQVNFTFKLKFDFLGDFFDFYLDLRRAQPTSYAALINTGSHQILSLSPELFFRRNKLKASTKPMKGTVQRGISLQDDKQAKRILAVSPKMRAENIMIVDMVRNDLGRIAEKVWTEKLFEIEQYRTLHQMTSTVKAKLNRNLTQKDIFSAIFPCSSVTGAPKIKTMEIIHELEKESRGIYTGAIGYMAPEAKSCFNVAIRTIELRETCGQLGVGGGVVYDSIDKLEYEEALLKAKFFIEGFSKMQLIESLLWTEEGGYYLLDLHLKRLKKSCDYFSIPLDTAKSKKLLKIAVNGQKGKTKVIILIGIDGSINVKKEYLADTCQPVRVKLSKEKVNPQNQFLYHKTTRRKLYDQERQKALTEGFFEVIFLNIYDQLTEGAISNIFILKDNCLYTPAVKSGLLPGILREYLIRKNRAKEKILYLKDIKTADRVYIGSSVRGLLEAKVIFSPSNISRVLQKA